MKIRNLLTALAATLLATGSASAQTQMKIGIVDMKRVFQEYYKTKDAEKKVNEDKSKAKKDLDQRNNTYQKLIDQWNEASKIVQDKLVNAELKQQKKAEADKIASEIKALEREIDEFRRRREQQLQEQVMRMRKGLLDDISQRVEEKAKLDNYDLVFDKSGVSPSGVKFLLHSKDAVDFSNQVLAELNKNAPKESLAQPAPTGDSELTPK
ncbi:MAG TPA: OmpH family outer membrane protein [Verrucomicrobiales bacterium]|jgi:outer membrane protein|nr:OmpH family outer membrane protein [Verrucomicrobiales bacterium]